MNAEAALAIEGVAIRRLSVNSDTRGQLTELFRASWPEAIAARQWNLLQCQPRSLRGVHLHHRHWDYLTLAAGRLLVGLKDCRGDGGLSAMLELDAAAPVALRIPPGVAHGLLSMDAAVVLLGVDDYWDPADELGCRYDDPALGFDWPLPDPLLSARDRSAGSFAALLEAYAAALGRPA